MNILIIGCGKVGSELASRLSEAGHDISVVDSDARNFTHLSDSFNGMTFEGFECDQDVLRRAGIAACDIVAVVTHDDNINIMAAQIAHNVFNVRRVVTRIYDPEREDAYKRFGLQTICPTKLTIDAVYSATVEAELAHKTLHFGMSTLSFAIENPGEHEIGMSLSDLAKAYARENVLLFGTMHPSGEMTMVVESPERKLSASDRLVVSHKVD
ncbi:MAG TPA: TrkA family potassium uptake protein [Oscillospiraceae bacterium]|nr:TrkA family potassium uptake protein [Oscillospiraceae bacterium]HPS35400.1 TrkA family potassium uptake protein [Oscillospiraceae bacterium]